MPNGFEALLSPVSAAVGALWIVAAVVAPVLARRKLRSGSAWLLLALSVGPLALLGIACLGSAGLPCHACQERIGPHQRVCGFCGVPRFERRSRREVAADWVRERIAAVDMGSLLDIRGLLAVGAALALCAVAGFVTADPPTAVGSRRAARPTATRDPFPEMNAYRPQVRDATLREAIARVCTPGTQASLETMFPDKHVQRFDDGQPAGGHVVLAPRHWRAASAQSREAAARTAALCIFGGRDFEVRDPWTGRPVAEWNRIAGYLDRGRR